MMPEEPNDAVAASIDAAAPVGAPMEGDTLAEPAAEPKQPESSSPCEDDKLRRELAEFRTLYPDVPIGAIGEDVFEASRGGLPLAAAYALSARRQELRSGRPSAPVWSGLGTGASDALFSRAEVKAMSEEEVHKHYKRIRESMKHW